MEFINIPDSLIANRDLDARRIDFYYALFLKRDYEGYVTFSCDHLLKMLNIKPNATNKYGAFYKLKDFLVWMGENEIIDKNFDYANLKLKELVCVKYDNEKFCKPKGRVELRVENDELKLRGDELLLYCSLKWKTSSGSKTAKVYKGTMAGLTGLTQAATDKALNGLAAKKYLKYSSVKYKGTFIELTKFKEAKNGHTN